MEEKNKKAYYFIKELLNLDLVKALDFYDDQGVKVSTHTYDVLNLSIDEILKQYKTLEEASEILDFFAITVGVIIHDISKASIRDKEENLSHSQMMIKNPEYILKEVEAVLKLVEEKTGYFLKKTIKKRISHIVISHHGRWGKIQPSTKEACIVHKGDMYSAKYHRINPIGADAILSLMDQGYSLEETAEKLNCTFGVIKDRLKRSRMELKISTIGQLLNYYQKHKKVPLGDEFFILRVEETKKLKKLVDRKGFETLILENPLIPYFQDDIIFIENVK